MITPERMDRIERYFAERDKANKDADMLTFDIARRQAKLGQYVAALAGSTGAEWRHSDQRGSLYLQQALPGFELHARDEVNASPAIQWIVAVLQPPAHLEVYEDSTEHKLGVNDGQGYHIAARPELLVPKLEGIMAGFFYYDSPVRSVPPTVGSKYLIAPINASA